MPSFSTRGFDIYYETHGFGDGDPLILIMGMGGTCQGWTVLQVPELARDRTTVIFDNRGAGRSADPGGPFTTRDMADDTLALMDELGFERAHVLGAFLGGMVAQEVALAAPSRVQGLVLAGTWAAPDGRRRMLLDLWKSMRESGLPTEDLIKTRLVWTLHDLTFDHQDLIDAMWQFYLEDDAWQEDKVFVRQIEAALAHDSLDRLEQIQSPTLIICGEQDLLTPLHMHRQLANGIPTARLVPMAGAGHLIAAELAPRFNRLVSRFLLEYDHQKI
jgi:pimeloyl-ACP methyl ester carboxylesterase